MGKVVLLNASIVVNSVDLSEHCSSVTLETKVNAVDSTGFTDGATTVEAGLVTNSVKIDFQQDFAASSVEATIYPLIGTKPTVVVRPSGMTTSTTNPSYSFTPLVDDWLPVDGKIGDLLVSSVSWDISGAIVKATS